RPRQGSASNRRACGKRPRMAVDTSYPGKRGASVFAGRRGGSGRGRGQHAHKIGKRFNVRDYRRVRIGSGRGGRGEVEGIVRSLEEETAGRFRNSSSTPGR